MHTWSKKIPPQTHLPPLGQVHDLFNSFGPQAYFSKRDYQNYRVRGWSYMEIHGCTLCNQIKHIQGTQNDTLWLVLMSINK